MPDPELTPPYQYFVDGNEYKTSDTTITGAQIKAQLPNFDPSYQLILEGEGGNPDQVISDNQSIAVNTKPPKRFYTAPPATFGQA